MLDLARLKAISLYTRPLGQRLVANLMLSVDYRLPRPTDIVLEGLDNLPRDRPVFLAMNHTDRYNYWPFQYAMHLRGLRYTATWVKGKYYEHPLTGGEELQGTSPPTPPPGSARFSPPAPPEATPPDVVPDSHRSSTPKSGRIFSN